MEKFEEYKPKSLLELSNAGVAELSSEDQHELVELVMLETRETMEALSVEIDKMDEEIFSLDSFYEIQSIIEEYKVLIDALAIDDENFKKDLQLLLEKIEKKSPIFEVAKNNRGNVLIHSSDLMSLRNLFKKRSHISEVCTTVGSLRKKGDVFCPNKKSIHAGLIFDPEQASAWFSRDVGSHTSGGKRVIKPQFEQFRCNSLAEALNHQSGERIEAWIDTQIAQPVALLLIDPNMNREVVQLAREQGLPVLFNSHLYE